MRQGMSDDRISRSVSYLISMLVRYPEVSTVKYEPRLKTLRMGLLVTGELDEQTLLRVEDDLFNTLEVYHLIEQRPTRLCEVVSETFGELTSVAITRDVGTLTPEEIYVIVEFFRERFAGRLVSEQIEFAGEDELIAQDEMIHEMLTDLHHTRNGKNLIAIREDGRVMVFQK